MGKGRRGAALALAAVLMLALTPPGAGPARTATGPARVPEQTPLVALTFDDGPGPETTKRLLDGLALREVPATFFLIGCQLEGNGDLVREMKARGHQIGIHTFDHVKVVGLSRAEYDEQLGKTREALTAILGPGEWWFRPPYGLMDEETRARADTPLVLWSVDPEDWKDRDTERIVAAVTEQTEDGDIILLHDIYDSSVDAALRIVDTLLDRGFAFVTVEQLLALRGVEPEPGMTCIRFP